jgi:hypothetical protein
MARASLNAVEAELRACETELRTLQANQGDADKAKMDALKNSIGGAILKLAQSKMVAQKDDFRWVLGLDKVIQSGVGTRDETIYSFDLTDTSERDWLIIAQGRGRWYNLKTKQMEPMEVMQIQVKTKPTPDSGFSTLIIPLASVHNMTGSIQEWSNGNLTEYNYYWWLRDGVETVVKQIWQRP